MNKVQVIVLPDPELILPDETLTPAHAYRAMSAFIGADYVSLAALIKRRKAVEAQLNSQMADWQRAIATPCSVMYSVRNDKTGERLEIFAHITSPIGFLETERAKGVTDDVKKRRLVKRLEDAHKRGWLYGRWHSRTQPDGEYGVMHRALIQRVVDEAEFLRIGAAGWKVE